MLLPNPKKNETSAAAMLQVGMATSRRKGDLLLLERGPEENQLVLRTQISLFMEQGRKEMLSGNSIRQ